MYIHICTVYTLGQKYYHDDKFYSLYTIPDHSYIQLKYLASLITNTGINEKAPKPEKNSGFSPPILSPLESTIVDIYLDRCEKNYVYPTATPSTTTDFTHHTHHSSSSHQQHHKRELSNFSSVTHDDVIGVAGNSDTILTGTGLDERSYQAWLQRVFQL